MDDIDYLMSRVKKYRLQKTLSPQYMAGLSNYPEEVKRYVKEEMLIEVAKQALQLSEYTEYRDPFSNCLNIEVDIFMFSKEELIALLRDVPRYTIELQSLQPPKEEEEKPEIQVLFEPGKRTFRL